MRLILYREIPPDQKLQQQWNALVQEMECPEVFYTYEWALAVYRAYSTRLTPLLILAFEGESLVGVVALATSKSEESTFFLAASTADYCDFVSHPKKRMEFVSSSLAELRALGLIELTLANLPADSQTAEALKLAPREHDYASFSRTGYECAQVILSSSGQKKTVLESVRKKDMLRRHLKALARMGPVELQHLKSWDSISETLPRFIEAHLSRFGNSGRVSNLAVPERRLFLAELAKLLSKPEWITLSCLMVGDRQVAWNYGFQFAGSWFWYQPTFDDGFRRHYPGYCLLGKIVEGACESSHISRVDLGLGDEGYKGRFATDSRRTLHVILAQSKVRCLKEGVRYHAASAIKSFPQVEHYIRRLTGKRAHA